MVPLHNDLQDFKAAAAGLLDKDDENSFFSLEDVFGELVFDGDFLSAHINAELDAVLKRPLELPTRWCSRHIVVRDEPRWQILHGQLSGNGGIHSKPCVPRHDRRGWA